MRMWLFLLWEQNTGRESTAQCTAQCSGPFLMWVVEMGEFNFLM